MREKNKNERSFARKRKVKNITKVKVKECLDMKKKNVIMIAAAILALGMIGTSVACGDSGQGETKQENTTEIKEVEKKTTDNKKENEKVQDDVLSDSKVDAVEASTQNENVVSEKETDSDANVHTANTSVTNTSSGNRTGNSSSTSLGNNIGNSSIAPSGNSTNNSSSNSSSSQPTHTHTWVHIDATGHYVTVTIQAAYDEEIPVYSEEVRVICNVCGADTTGNEIAHDKAHLLAYEGSGYHTELVKIQTGIQTIHHDAVTENRWVQDSPAYDRCSTCGTTK